MTDASVVLWGRRIGAVSWDEARALGIFQYDPAFVGAGIEVAPLKMPVREAPYEFHALPKETFKGLPGMLADALPDKFGNRLIDAWLAETGRNAGQFSPVDRLCYIGNRGIGALEFEPTVRKATRSKKLEVAQLVDLANRVLSERENLAGRLGGEDDAEALEDILSVGTSAGGARAKAVLAWNRASQSRRGVRALAIEVRRSVQQPRQRARRPARLWKNRVRILPDGDGSGHRHVGMQASP